MTGYNAAVDKIAYSFFQSAEPARGVAGGTGGYAGWVRWAVDSGKYTRSAPPNPRYLVSMLAGRRTPDSAANHPESPRYYLSITLLLLLNFWGIEPPMPRRASLPRAQPRDGGVVHAEHARRGIRGCLVLVATPKALSSSLVRVKALSSSRRRTLGPCRAVRWKTYSLFLQSHGFLLPLQLARPLSIPSLLTYSLFLQSRPCLPRRRTLGSWLSPLRCPQVPRPL
jgi:hypothetical protein